MNFVVGKMKFNLGRWENKYPVWRRTEMSPPDLAEGSTPRKVTAFCMALVLNESECCCLCGAGADAAASFVECVPSSCCLWFSCVCRGSSAGWNWMHLIVKSRLLSRKRWFYYLCNFVILLQANWGDFVLDNVYWLGKIKGNWIDCIHLHFD